MSAMIRAIVDSIAGAGVADVKTRWDVTDFDLRAGFGRGSLLPMWSSSWIESAEEAVVLCLTVSDVISRASRPSCFLVRSDDTGDRRTGDGAGRDRFGIFSRSTVSITSHGVVAGLDVKWWRPLLGNGESRWRARRSGGRVVSTTSR